MDIVKFERDVIDSYKKSTHSTMDARIAELLLHVKSEWGVEVEQLPPSHLSALVQGIIDQETATLHDELQGLLAQKERLERQIDRRREALQESKYQLFDLIETHFERSSESLRVQLHQIKLQSLDLFDMLQEMVESAIIMTLEKGQEIEETIREVTKEITYETLSEGALSTVRTRKVVDTILHVAINIAEASPNQAEEILRGTLRGIRSGLVRSLSRLKKRLVYAPQESKSSLVELESEPFKVDQLFSQVIAEASEEQSRSCAQTLLRVSREMSYDMQELVELSRETLELMRERFSVAMERGSKVLSSKTAQEAKRMGITAWSSAKIALNSAIKSAKEKIENK